MEKDKGTAAIEKSFQQRVQKDPKVRNAYLLVDAKPAGIHLNLAAGKTGNTPANPKQPQYMASVGKLFTATLIGILAEHGQLRFEEKIDSFLEPEIMHRLHVYKGKDHSHELEIKHLLGQTSGLADDFWPLLDRLIADPDQMKSPRQAIEWVQKNTQAHFPPGQGFHYTDTNYHLLGLVIESITAMPFHVAIKEYLFDPLGMNQSYMLHQSEPAQPSPYPLADFYLRNTRLNDVSGYGRLDYAGGGVVATNEDLLKFMQALVSYQILSESTLYAMKSDRSRYGMGIEYGYGIWQITPVFLLMPKKLCSWGAVGVTGAFLFYHPQTKAFIVGNFNDDSYQSQAIRFMLLKVINPLTKCLR